MNSNCIFLLPKALFFFSCKGKKLRVLCLNYFLIFFLFPTLTLAQIVADNNAVFSGQPSAAPAGNTYTINNLNIPAGNNVALVIMAKHSLASITNINFNGADYTSNVYAFANAGFQTQEIWVIPLGILASALNNMTVTITISGSTLTYGAIAATFRNVNQTTPANNPTVSQPAGGVAFNSTLSIPSAFGDMLVDCLSSTQTGNGSHDGANNLISNALINPLSTSFLSASYASSLGNPGAIGWNLFGTPISITHLGLNLKWDDAPPDNSITVSGSGCEPAPGISVDGVYTLEGEVNGKNYYIHNNRNWWILWCTVCSSNEVNQGNSDGWLIVDQGSRGENFVYFNPTDSDLPPAEGWSVYLTGFTLCPPPVPVLSGAVFLPVDLLSFSGQAQEDHSILLNWQTGNEVNNDGFEVQHSLDGTQWEVLDFVGGYGNTEIHQDYAFIHYGPTTNTSHYYRLKQIDFDGAYEYSDVVSVDLADNPTASKLSIYPNPAKERLQLLGIQAEQVRIVDHLGRRMLFQLMDDNSIDISNLETGLYLLTIDAGQEMISRRFVKH